MVLPRRIMLMETVSNAHGSSFQQDSPESPKTGGIRG